MNCEKGDMAFVVTRGTNKGKIVRCVYLASPAELLSAWFADDEGPVWRIDRELEMSVGAPDTLCRDRALRPIRPHGDDEQDESKAWLPPVPTLETV